jgi:hypothetical protein
MAALVSAAPSPAAAEPSATFFLRFVELEAMLRELWQKRTGGERLSRREGAPTFREMLEALAISEVLPRDLYDRLLTLNKYRNLVFHGQLREIARTVLDDLARAKHDVATLLQAPH